MDNQDKQSPTDVLAKFAAASMHNAAASKSIYGFKQKEGVNVPFLTPKRLAEQLGVSVKALERMRKDGSGPPYTQFGKRFIRYPITTLDAWVSAALHHGQFPTSTIKKGS